jgi:hypothetical protein
VKNLSGAPLKGRLLASPTNIRLGWKGWPVTITQAQAYDKKFSIIAVNFLLDWSPSGKENLTALACHLTKK